MDTRAIAVELKVLRLAADPTQSALADRMRTTQAAIARAESGRLSPRLDFADHWARSCWLPLKLVLGDDQDPLDRAKRRAMTRDMFGDNNGDPYDSALTDVERRTLAATRKASDPAAPARLREGAAKTHEARRVKPSPGIRAH